MTEIVTSDYTLAAGQQLSGVNEAAVYIQGPGWNNVTLNGQVQVTVSGGASPVVAIGADSANGAAIARTLTIGATGNITVNSSTTGFAGGITISGNLIKVLNLGAIEITAQGLATGVSTGSGGFENRGALTVHAVGARGVNIGPAAHQGGSFVNSGTIVVTGAGGIGVLIYNYAETAQTYVNTGQIRAIDGVANPISTGVMTGGPSALVNSGLIEGDRSVVIVRNDNLVDGVGDHTVTNSGTLRGTVFLNNATPEPVLLRNSGAIQGEVALNLGADTYNGVGGTVSGVVHGDTGGDSLVGGSGAETLVGDAGNDTIDGGSGGADVLDGGDGVDTLSFGAFGSGIRLDLGVGAGSVSTGVSFSNFERYAGSNLADTLIGSAAGDTMGGAGGDDTINGGSGNDVIDGGAGQGYLRGDDGNDVISGGSSFDDANGNMGNDTVSGGAGDDYAVGGKDNDLLFGDEGQDIVWGNLGDDTCDGGAGNDQVRGGQGNDSVSGGTGNDFVSGDRGDDTISGGAGADNFHGSQDAGVDRVLDFHVAEGDRVQLDPGTTYVVNQVGSDTIIDMGGGNQMILVGVPLASLPAGTIFLG